MKIVFTAGGSAGHFYPIIAVAEEMNDIINERNLIRPEMYYLSNEPYDEGMLFQNNIQYKHVSAGKIRRYFSLRNFTDFAKTLVGLPTALHLLYKIWPDVVFTKGSYASVPVVIAAFILRIPVFTHDSDAVPGRANLLAGKFATRIGISYAEAAQHFPKKDVIAHVGNPIRRDIKIPQRKDAHAYFQFLPDLPTLLVLGGSQGAEHINNIMLQALPDLLQKYQIIHQVGKDNFDSYTELLDVELKDHPYRSRYKVYPYLDVLPLRMAAGVSDLVISRAGSGTIFEIALWEKPALLVPIPEAVSRDQRENAYAYARAGGAEVIEQHNCTPHVLMSEIDRVLGSEKLMESMREGARKFKKPNAARVIAEEILRIALEHENVT